MPTPAASEANPTLANLPDCSPLPPAGGNREIGCSQDTPRWYGASAALVAQGVVLAARAAATQGGKRAWRDSSRTPIASGRVYISDGGGESSSARGSHGTYITAPQPCITGCGEAAGVGFCIRRWAQPDTAPTFDFSSPPSVE